MIQYEGISKEFAKSNRNRAAFMFSFTAISFLIGAKSYYPTSLFAYVAGIIFLAIATKHFRMYFKWNFGISDDGAILEEMRKKYAANSIMSVTGAVNGDEIMRIVEEESRWLNNYIRYVKFGAAWGVLYAIVTILIVGQIKYMDDWMFAILFNGVILFVLGESIADYFAIRLQNPYARLSAAHLIGYMPIFVIAGIINYENLAVDLVAYFSDPIVRLVLVAMAVFAYQLLDIHLPE